MSRERGTRSRLAGISPRHVLFAAAATIGAATTLGVLLGSGHGSAATLPTRAAASRPVSSSLSNVLGLAPMPAGRRAPLFTLADQRGRRVSLAALRGKVVVLEPMDPRCTDICPIVSREFVVAAHALGPARSRVVFLGVNVNQFHERRADVAAFSREHGLAALPDWHFLTGPTPALKRIWRAYDISVTPNPTGDVSHSALMLFIDPQGDERWVAWPNPQQAEVTRFGTAIATLAKQMLRSA